MTDTDTLAAVERWSRSRGIPHFIELAIFVLLVPALDLLAGGQRLTALNTQVAGFVSAFSGVYLTVCVRTNATDLASRGA